MLSKAIVIAYRLKLARINETAVAASEPAKYSTV